MSNHSQPSTTVHHSPRRSPVGHLRRAVFAMLALALLTATVGSTPAGASIPAHPSLRGSLDLVSSSAGHIRVAGWSVDSIASGRSNSEDIVVDGAMAALPIANQPRADVNRVLGITGRHGFGVTIPATAGSHRVCVVTRPIPDTGGHDSLLACRVVRVK